MRQLKRALIWTALIPVAGALSLLALLFVCIIAPVVFLLEGFGFDPFAEPYS